MLFQSEKKRKAGKMELERHSVIDQLIKKQNTDLLYL